MSASLSDSDFSWQVKPFYHMNTAQCNLKKKHTHTILHAIIQALGNVVEIVDNTV